MAKKSDTDYEPAVEEVAPVETAPAADAPGKEPEKAAASGAEPTVVEGMAPLGQGAQVILTGDAVAAARGGTHGSIEANSIARDEAIAAGHVVPGTTAEAAADATMAGELPDADPDAPAVA